MTKLDPTAEAHLKVFEAAYQVYETTRDNLESTLRERLETEITSLRMDASKAANRAVAAGVPITRLGDKAGHGMRTKNFNTIRAFLDLSADLVTVTAEDLYVDPLDERYSFDAETLELEVTLTADETAHGVTVYGWTETASAGLDLSRAVFDLGRRADGSQYLDPVTELATAARGWFMHPAVCWVMRNKEHYAEALAYATGRADQ